MKRKFSKWTNSIKKEWQRLKNDPKLYWMTILNNIREYIKNNTLFFTLVISGVFNGLLLRFFTIHTVENFFSLKPLLADFTIVVLFASFGYLMKAKNRFPYYMILSIIFTAICIINSIYYTYYSSFTSISLLSTSRFVVDVGDAVVENVMRIQDWVYLWAPIALIVVYIHLKKTGVYYTEENKREQKHKDKFKHSFITALVCALAFCVTLTPVQIGRFVKLWNREYTVMNFGIYTYHLNDLVQSIEPKLTTLFGYDNAMKTFKEFYQDKPDQQETTNEYTNIFKGKNVIVIHCESMQALNMTLKFNGEELTPNLNKLAREGIFFDNFYAQVSVGTSSDSEFTFNTSLMPTSSGTAFVSYFDREYITIPKLLKEQGYYTFSMHANKANFWNRDVMYQSLGYDRFYSKVDYEIDDVIGLGLSDKSFFLQSVEKIKEINAEGKPYYGVLLMLSNHTPFSDVDKYGDFPVDIKETVIDPETGLETVVSHPYMEGTKLGNYFKSVHYADEALGEFFALLEQENLLDNTVIVLYGDHDARLPIEDYVRLFNYNTTTDEVLSSDDPNYINFDEYQYELNRKVPFIIWSKETQESLHKTVSNVMGMYDVMPTLGNMFGFYNKYQLGHDIFDIQDQNIVVFPNGNWVTNKVYYNAQKNAYLPLKEEAISEEYIQQCNDYASQILSTSNSLIVFDLIKKEQEISLQNGDYIEERTNP